MWIQVITLNDDDDDDDDDNNNNNNNNTCSGAQSASCAVDSINKPGRESQHSFASSA